MFTASLLLTMTSIVALSVLGLSPVGLAIAGYSLLGAVVVNLFRKSFGFVRSFNKLRKLRKIHKALNLGQDPKELMSEAQLKNLMKKLI